MGKESIWSKIKRWFVNVKAVVVYTFVGIVAYSLVLDYKVVLFMSIFGLVFSVISYFKKEA